MIYNKFNKLETQKISKCFYDIEVMPHNFSIVCLFPEVKRGFVFTLDDFPNLYDYETIDSQLKERWKDEYTLDCYHCSNDICNNTIQEGNEELFGFLALFCQDKVERKNGKPFSVIREYYGWNSDKYDLPIMVYLYSYMLNSNHLPPRASLLRELSDAVITKELRSFYALSNYVSGNTKIKPKMNDDAKRIYKTCIETQNHIDIGAINEKSKDTKKGSQFMFPLKVMASYCGLDIVEDETTRLDFDNWNYETLEPRFKASVYEDKTLKQNALYEMLHYNINDVDVTYKIALEKEYFGTLTVKDGLRSNYPFLLQPDEKGRVLGRSATMAQLSGKIIRGENQNVLVDDPTVDLTYPFADGHEENLLDFVEKHETVHPLMLAFYRHFDGKDMRSRESFREVLNGSITSTKTWSQAKGEYIYEHSSTCNIPYMDKDGKSLNTYITLSIGGAHGGVGLGFTGNGKRYDNMYGRDMTNPKDWEEGGWLRDFAISKVDTCTIDVKDIIHADFASYYPSMNILLGVYVGEDGVDNYKQVRDDRIKVKESIPSDLSTWTDEDVMNENTQLGMKLVINSATGASNQHMEHVDLPLDNCTTRMRIMGNILIYVLGQRFANEGGFVFSTNTDGLYLTGVSKEKAKEICDDFMSTYGLSIEPEPLARMINKSANERIEYEHPTVPNRVGGALGRSTGKRIPLDSNIKYPRVCGKAVLDYMSNQPDWLEKPINANRLREYLERYLEDDVYKTLDWTVTLKGNRNRKFILYLPEFDENGQEKVLHLSDTNRVVLSNKGNDIVQLFKGKQTKITDFTSTSVEVLNLKSELETYDRTRLNVDAYLEWALNILQIWYNPKPIPELEPDRVQVIEEVDLFDGLDWN